MTERVGKPPDAATWVVEYAPFIWRVLCHLGVPMDRLEDASQDVLLIAIDRGSYFQGRSSLSTWLYGICRNVAHLERRRQARSVRSREPLPETVVQPAQEGEVWVKRAHQQLVMALSQLDEEQREVFILFEVEEMSMEEIAEAKGAPLSTCYSRLQKARQKVHATLRQQSLHTRSRYDQEKKA